MQLDELFTALVGIPSPSRQERRVADWIGGHLQHLGLSVEEDDSATQHGGDCGNLLVRLPATDPARPSLLLCAHLDTVETGTAPIVPTFEDGVFLSQGDTILGADDKCGVACLLALIDLLQRPSAPKHGELRILFTVCEEIELQGVRHLPPAWLEGLDAGMALDHSFPNQIVQAAPGKNVLKTTLHGISGHASSPERRINAAHVLVQILSRLPNGRLDDDSTCNLGILNAGRAVNVIPGLATCEIEVRSRCSDRLSFYTEKFCKIIHEGAESAAIWVDGEEEPRQASAAIERNECYPSFHLPADSLPVRLMERAIQETGHQPERVLGKGGSDANLINAMGVPSVVIGTGLHGAHSVRERASLKEMEQCLATLLALLECTA
ncbi:MAG: M20/M25/M40 family metallo-hydrolase [Planctomycetota bacterium]